MNQQTVFRNVTSIAIGQVVILSISFFSITLTARFLDVTSFGVFNYLLAITVIASKFVDFGMSPIVFRETSKYKTDFNFINNALSLRLILFTVIFTLFNVFAFISRICLIEILLADILFINIIISSKYQVFREIFDVPFKVNFDMHLVMLVNILDNFFFLILIILIPFFNGGIIYVICSYVFANFPGFILEIVLLKKKYQYKFKLDFAKYKWLLVEAFPLSGYVFLIAFFQQIDVLFLKYFDSEYATGIFAAGVRLTMPLTIIPSALLTTFFPKIVENIKENNGHNSYLINFIHKILFLSSFIMSIIISCKSKEIAVLLFGQNYSEAAFPMVLILWSYVFLFYCYLSLDVITAHNKQRINFIFAVIVVLINIILLFCFVPFYSYVGVGFAKLITSLIGAIFIAYNLRTINIKLLFINKFVLLWVLVVVLFIYLLSYLPLFIYFITSSIAVVFWTIVLNYFTNEELRILFKLINKEKLFDKFQQKLVV